MTALNRIRSILESLCEDEDVPMEAVYYGMCPERSLPKWNYFVFDRLSTTKASNRLDWETRYQIHIIHEDYIPEQYVERVIAALEAPGNPLFRTTTDSVSYQYTTKGNTSVVVELATITVVHPEIRRHAVGTAVS